MLTLEQAINDLMDASRTIAEVAESESDEANRINAQNVADDCKQIAELLRELQRARVLLKATHDLLEAADDSPYVEDVLGILVHYDDTDCDGSCLMEDIEYYFDEFGEERKTDEQHG